MKFLRNHPNNNPNSMFTRVTPRPTPLFTEPVVEKVEPVVSEPVAPITEPIAFTPAEAIAPIAETVTPEVVDPAHEEAVEVAEPIAETVEPATVSEPIEEPIEQSPEEIVEQVVDEIETLDLIEHEPVIEPAMEQMPPIDFTSKFAIPGIDDIVPALNPIEPEQSVQTDTAPLETIEDVPTVSAEDVGSIELVDEVPEGEELTEGVEIVGELSLPVSDFIAEEVDVADEYLPEPEETDVPEEEVCDELDEVDDGAADAEVVDDSWDRFIDNVILPTLNTCVDKLKEFVNTDLVAELKSKKPDIKD